VEWVEVTAKSLEDAKVRALSQLGVAEKDAEIQVLEEPKTGMFGRVKGEARLRARVTPSVPRPRRQGGGRNGGRNRNRSEERGDGGRKEQGEKSPKQNSNKKKNDRPAKPKTEEAAPKRRNEKEQDMADGITLEEQAAVGKEFLEGLVAALGLEATVEIRPLEDDLVELALDGAEGLGVLVGPRGTTLAALQDVTRTVVQGRFPSKTDRILVDVARYRERRVAALGRFTAQVAQEVVASGEAQALEPMSPADRKAVHDAAKDSEGIDTRSDGEGPGRHVVIAPAN